MNQFASDGVRYEKETRTATFQGKTIVVENLTPVLSREQLDRRRREIEGQLYDVFRKYHVN